MLAASLALTLLVFARKKLKLSEPLVRGVCDFRPPCVVLVLNSRNVCVESVEVCLLAFTSGDWLIKVVADVFPRTSAISQRIPQEVGTGEIGGAAPTTEIDFLIAPGDAFADMAIEV
jgi:hypothetical protein